MALQLDDNDRRQLQQVFRVLNQRRQQRASPGYPEDQAAAGPLEEPKFDRLLLLLMLASRHSDGLAYIPMEMRRLRLLEWSDLTGFSYDLVLEATLSGPARLSELLSPGALGTGLRV